MAVHISQPTFAPSALPFVVPTPGQTIDDRVRRQLQNSSYPELRMIECHCHRGRLTIEGKVSSFFLKQTAQEALGHLQGIEQIDNQLVVYG